MNEVPTDPSPFFVRLLIAVAPEKGTQLTTYVQQNNVTFLVNENADRILFQAHPGQKRIDVGLKCLARLWASAYAYFCIYTDVADAKLANPSTGELDLRASERRRQAGDLLKWSIETDIAIQLESLTGFKTGESRKSFPFGLPRPFAASEYASDQHVADELFLVALSYILHHEMAHLRLGHIHQTGIASILQEKEADLEAANWLLDGLSDESDPKFVKRALGIAIGLAWLASLNVYVGSASTKTHPPAYDRLYQVLGQYIHDENHQVWAMVSLILSLHLQNQGLPFGENVEFQSFRHAANYYVDQVSKLGAG